MVISRPPGVQAPARRALPSATDANAVVALRVATWNLRHGRSSRSGGVDLGAVAARIAALDADVVAVQEVDRLQGRSGRADQVMEIAERLGWHGLFAATMIGRAGAMRPASPDGADDGGPAYGLGLLSRHPLTAPTTVVLASVACAASGGGGWVADNEPRVVLRAGVPTLAGEVGITTTHLSWLPWNAWRQARSVIELAAARPGPAVVAGDLNMPRAWVRAALRGSGWHVACAGATFPGCKPVVQLDHVLVRGGRLVDPHVGPALPSDHCVLGAAVVVRDLHRAVTRS